MNTKKDKRTRHIDIRLTDEEYSDVLKKATECGMTLSNYGRRVLGNHHPNKRLSEEDLHALNSLSDARADLIRIQNVLKGKSENVKKLYFHDISYMRTWISAINKLIIRWGEIRKNINNN